MGMYFFMMSVTVVPNFPHIVWVVDVGSSDASSSFVRLSSISVSQSQLFFVRTHLSGWRESSGWPAT